MIGRLPSQVEVQKLLKKQNRSKQQNDQLILAIKKGGYEMPDVSFDLAYNQTKKGNNTSDQKYINFEQLILNAIKIKIESTTIIKYLQHFAKEIGKTKYMQRLHGLLSFSLKKQKWKDPLESLIKSDASDLDSRKRMFVYYKREGRIDEYIKKLNDFLEETPSDTETWIELSTLYTERGLYLRALFCLQEVIVVHPQNQHYMVKLAQLYVTLGGKEDAKHAIKYYSHVITKNPKNFRALWGLYRVLINQGDRIEPQHLQLKQLCYDTIKSEYSKRNLSLKLNEAFQSGK